MSDNPAVILFDQTGTAMAVTASVLLPSGTTGLIAAGVGDDGITRYLNIDANKATRITGSVAVSGITFPGSMSVTGSVALSAPVALQRPPTSTRSTVVAVSSSVVLLPQNLSRVSTVLFNDSPYDSLISFGPSSSYAGGFTYYVPSYATLEFSQPVYTGIVSAVWEMPSGSMRVTEMVF